MQGSLRSRVESWDWFEGAANNDYTYSGNLLRLGFSQQRQSFDWQIERAAPFLLHLPDDAVASGTQGQLGLGANYFVANNRSTNAGMVFPDRDISASKICSAVNRKACGWGVLSLWTAPR